MPVVAGDPEVFGEGAGLGAFDDGGVFGVGEVDVGHLDAGFDAAEEVVGAAGGVDEGLGVNEGHNLVAFI